MDPNANLLEQLRLASNQGGRLAELVIALDDWIARGGFLPTRWDPAKRVNDCICMDGSCKYCQDLKADSYIRRSR